jgi:hypothetical protein
MTHLVLPLHECAVEPHQDVAKSVAGPPTVEVAVDPIGAEFAIRPLYSDIDPASSSAALTETFCLRVQV